jgi:hypothetical protein
VLGSRRPPKDSIVRYCLPCSEATGRLVERTAPALERQRATGAARSAVKAKAKREKLSQAKADGRSAAVLVDGKLTKVRIDHLLRRVWALPTRRAETPRLECPDIHVRRSRSNGYSTGHCHVGWGQITVTIGKDVDFASALAVVIHEAAHEITYMRERNRDHHGPLFRSVFRSLVSEWTGVDYRTEGHEGDKYEFHQAMIRHLREHEA